LAAVPIAPVTALHKGGCFTLQLIVLSSSFDRVVLLAVGMTRHHHRPAESATRHLDVPDLTEACVSILCGGFFLDFSCIAEAVAQELTNPAPRQGMRIPAEPTDALVLFVVQVFICYQQYQKGSGLRLNCDFSQRRIPFDQDKWGSLLTSGCCSGDSHLLTVLIISFSTIVDVVIYSSGVHSKSNYFNFAACVLLRLGYFSSPVHTQLLSPDFSLTFEATAP